MDSRCAKSMEKTTTGKWRMAMLGGKGPRWRSTCFERTGDTSRMPLWRGWLIAVGCMSGPEVSCVYVERGVLLTSANRGFRDLLSWWHVQRAAIRTLAVTPGSICRTSLWYVVFDLSMLDVDGRITNTHRRVQRAQPHQRVAYWVMASPIFSARVAPR